MMRFPSKLSKPIQRMARQAIWEYRQATSRVRSFPHFILIGAQKSGTSSLFRYLTQHPQILRSFTKEVHYFDGGLNARLDTYQEGQEWYRAHFPMRATLGQRRIAGEASPFYIFHPLVAERIASLLPEVKLIAVLRNPTERAISHYFHTKRKGHEPLSIGEALRKEEERLKPVLQQGDWKDPALRRFSYKSRGHYEEQLERYSRCFSREQLLILSSEELFGQPAETLLRIFQFLGVEGKVNSIDLRPKNVATDKSLVSAEVYEYLDDYFMSRNQALFELIGREFSWQRAAI
jgi:hypothetical protein